MEEDKAARRWAAAMVKTEEPMLVSEAGYFYCTGTQEGKNSVEIIISVWTTDIVSGYFVFSSNLN